MAAHQGHLEVVRFLVESGANKDQGATDDGATPLHIAAAKGRLEVVRFLVESGANKDQGTTDDGATPLHIAAAKGHLEVVRFLVESGANKDQGTTDDGATPLHIAAAKGHLEVVRFLVESGANKGQGARDDGVTPLVIAANGEHVEVVRCVVRSDANKEQDTRRHGLTRLVCDQRDVLDGVGECRRVLKRLRCSSCRAGWARDLEPQCRRRFDKFGGAVAGARVALAPCDGPDASTAWELQGNGQITLGSSNMCLSQSGFVFGLTQTLLRVQARSPARR